MRVEGARQKLMRAIMINENIDNYGRPLTLMCEFVTYGAQMYQDSLIERKTLQDEWNVPCWVLQVHVPCVNDRPNNDILHVLYKLIIKTES